MDMTQRLQGILTANRYTPEVTGRLSSLLGTLNPSLNPRVFEAEMRNPYSFYRRCINAFIHLLEIEKLIKAQLDEQQRLLVLRKLMEYYQHHSAHRASSHPTPEAVIIREEERMDDEVSVLRQWMERLVKLFALIRQVELKEELSLREHALTELHHLQVSRLIPRLVQAARLEEEQLNTLTESLARWKGLDLEQVAKVAESHGAIIPPAPPLGIASMPQQPQLAKAVTAQSAALVGLLMRFLRENHIPKPQGKSYNRMAQELLESQSEGLLSSLAAYQTHKSAISELKKEVVTALSTIALKAQISQELMGLEALGQDPVLQKALRSITPPRPGVASGKKSDLEEELAASFRPNPFSTKLKPPGSTSR